jgi:hypothetical protein
MLVLEKLLRSKVVVWTLLVLPGLWPLWPIFVREDASVTADPLKFVLHHLGFVACVQPPVFFGERRISSVALVDVQSLWRRCALARRGP